MTKLEELHFPHSLTWDCWNDEPLKENHALKSAEITTDVAVKFAEFLCKYPDKNKNVYGKILHAKSKYDGADTTENLFEKFINNHYTK